MHIDSLLGKWLLLPVLALALFTYLGATPTVNGQTAASEQIVVTGDDVASAYGAPAGFSRARFTPTTSAYVLPPWTFYFGEIYRGRCLPPRSSRPSLHTGSRNGIAIPVWCRS